MKNFTLLLILLSITCQLNARDEDFTMEFGSVDIELLKQTAYELDSGATGFIVGDLGTTTFNLHNSYRFQMIFKRHIRIKFISKGSYEHANFSIPIYGSENLKNLKAVTYNLNNGAIETSELDKEQIFEEKVIDDWKQVKFSMPNVSEGSVIDVYYEIYSFYVFNLRGWKFQSTIPVARSIYQVEIPQELEYLTLTQGTQPLSRITNEESRSSSFMLKTTKYEAENMSAIDYEKFISTPEDFITKIEFQLAYLGTTKYLSDWGKVEKILLESEYFGYQINRKGVLGKEVEELTDTCKTLIDKAKTIYTYLQDTIEWNKYRGFSSENIKKALKDGTGSIGDINLLLVALLRAAGFRANPVILSTRDNGRVHPVYPLINKFNYVIAILYHDNQSYFLDASDPYLPFGMIPKNCLNIQGREIMDYGSKWVKLDEKCPVSNKMVMANFEITEKELLKGNISFSCNSYESMDHKKMIKENGEEEYRNKLTKENQNWKIKHHNFKNISNKESNFISKYDVEVSSLVNKSSDNIFINPIIQQPFYDELFKQESRDLPIDFVTPFHETFMFTLSIPDGYEVDETPVKAAFALPNNDGIFSYHIVFDQEKVVLNYNLNMNKSFFLPQEYASLKRFFEVVLAKQKEQIVLKKQSVTY